MGTGGQLGIPGAAASGNDDADKLLYRENQTEKIILIYTDLQPNSWKDPWLPKNYRKDELNLNLRQAKSSPLYFKCPRPCFYTHNPDFIDQAQAVIFDVLSHNRAAAGNFTCVSQNCNKHFTSNVI